VPWRQIEKIDEAMPAMRAEGYHLVALEMTADAVAFTDYEFPGTVCLVLGSEGAGVWPKTLRQCDGTVFIPMYGKHPSLNVHVSAAIVAYHVMLRLG
jgi:tRNA (guanosine-2'-O-)-methyltransferase